MKILHISLVFLILTAPSQSKTGRVLTEIGSIPDQFSVHLASSPDKGIRVNADGEYEINAAADDYVLILPEGADKYIYSPRVIPVSAIGVDTLYIIPPSFKEYTVIVDNQTGLSFRFIADRAFVSEALETAKKDYQLHVIAERGISGLLIAGLTEGRPAIIRPVSLLPDQERGYFKITRADVGLPPLEVRPAAKAQQEPPPVSLPAEESKTAVPEKAIPEEPPAIVEIEKIPPPEPEKIETPAEPESLKQVITVEKPELREIVVSTAAEASDRPLPLFANNQLQLMPPQRFMLSTGAEYDYFHPTPVIHYFGGSLGLRNITFWGQHFDVQGHIARSQDLSGILLRGSALWRPIPFAGLEVSYLNATSSEWDQSYFITRTQIGLTGNYLLSSDKGQFGIGARFQLDLSNFDRYVTNAVESGVRYLPSVYLITVFEGPSGDLGLFAGVVDEAAYLSVSWLWQDRISLQYAWKSQSQDDVLLSPIESAQRHHISFSYFLTLGR